MVDVAQIRDMLTKHFEIGEYTIDPLTGLVSTMGGVELKRKRVTRLPVQFDRVGGDFECSFNTLSSLVGSPTHVMGNFSCANNRLRSLAHSPLRVEGYFDCRSNLLTSLVGMSAHVGTDVWCENNKLVTLEGSPTHVNGDFNCSMNPLESLAHAPAPDHLGGDLFAPYSPSLPLLRLIMYPKVWIDLAPKAVRAIIQAHVGTGKPGAIRAAVDLIKAGYRENARW